MVLTTTRTLLKGKNSENTGKRRRDRCIGTSSASSSPCSAGTTLSFSVEGDLEKLVWPSRREDCEWMAGKVDLGGRDGDWVPGASQRSLASRISGASPSSSKARRERRKTRKKSSAKATASPSTPVVTKGKGTRQPLADITLEKRLNQNIGSESRPARTISPGWHRALRNLLLQADKERVGSGASP